MRASIEVKDRAEAEAVKQAMDNPTAKAMLVIVGLLAPLTSRQRKRVLDFVNDELSESTDAKGGAA